MLWPGDFGSSRGAIILSWCKRLFTTVENSAGEMSDGQWECTMPTATSRTPPWLLSGWAVGTGVFPESEEILIGGERPARGLGRHPLRVT
jgi:hypothetical protein